LLGKELGNLELHIHLEIILCSEWDIFAAIYNVGWPEFNLIFQCWMYFSFIWVAMEPGPAAKPNGTLAENCAVCLNVD
jgi:hypothetical protein